MTDEQYIEKLVLKGFEQRQVNQLLKIYTYTKHHNLDLSNISLSTNEDILRKIAQDFKDNKYTDKSMYYYYFLNVALDNDIDVIPYFKPEFNENQLAILINSQIEGVDVMQVLDPKYDEFQLRILIQGIKEGYDITTMCNCNFSQKKMECILNSYRQGIDISSYIDDFNVEQLEAINFILEKCKRKPTDLSLVFKKEYTVRQMYLIDAALRNGYDIDLLSKTCYSDEHLSCIYELLQNDVDPEYIEDTELSEKQVKSICTVMLHEDRLESFDFSIILDKKYNWAVIDTFGTIANDTSLVFELPKLMDESYSFEKIQELWSGICKDLDIDKYKDLEDIKEMHFVRRMLEYQKEDESFDISYYINPEIDIDERINTYIKSKIREIKFEKAEEEKNTCEFELSFTNDNQYFATEKNTIVEIGFDYDYNFDGDEFLSSLDEEFETEFLEAHRREFFNIIKDFFILGYNKDTDSIEMWDLLSGRTVETDVDKYYDDCIIEYTLDSDIIYDEFVEDTILYLDEGYTEKYEPAFETIYELKKYGGPNIETEILTTEIHANYEKHTLTLTLDNIKEIFGEINDENMNKAYNLLLNEAKMLEEHLDGYNYYYREYDLEGCEIDSCWGFIGSNAIGDIEANTSKFVKDLGSFDCIEDCLEVLKEIEEER